MWLFRHDRRTAPKFGTHVRIDTLTLKKNHPTPGEFRGLSIVKNLSRRTAPKFGTHVQIDTLTLKKIKILTHPTPGGFRGLSIAKHILRRTAPKFGTHVRIDTLTLIFFFFNFIHPTPGGFRGLSIVKNIVRRTAPKFGTHVRIDSHLLTFRDHLDFFVGQSLPSSSSTAVLSVFSHVSCQFVFSHIFSVVVSPSQSRYSHLKQN